MSRIATTWDIGEGFIRRRRIKGGEGWTSRGTWQSGEIRVRGRSLWRMSDYETYELRGKA